MQQIVQHAATRGVEVVPEIDIPGHSYATLRALPHLVELADADLEAPDGSQAWDAGAAAAAAAVVAEGIGSFPNNCLNPALPQTLDFLAHVLDEVVDLFAPCRRVHLGCDEVPRGAFVASPACRRLAQREGYLSAAGPGGIDETALVAHLMAPLQAQLLARGVEVMGWEEAAYGYVTPSDSLTQSGSGGGGDNGGGGGGGGDGGGDVDGKVDDSNGDDDCGDRANSSAQVVFGSTVSGGSGGGGDGRSCLDVVTNAGVKCHESLSSPSPSTSKAPRYSSYLRPPATVCAWKGRGEAGAVAAKAGFDVVMMPAIHTYLDLAESDHPDSPGLYWAAPCLTAEDAAAFDPWVEFPSASPDAAALGVRAEDGANAAACRNRVIGVGAALWGEVCRNREDMAARLFPRRLEEVARVAWIGKKSGGRMASQ